MAVDVRLTLNVTTTGTVDAIVATYSPAFTELTDGKNYAFVASGANTSTTPTLNINGLGAKTIKKKGGSALVAGDIPGAQAQMFVSYRATGTYFELVNPGSSGSGDVTGPGSSTNNAVVLFDGTTGKLIKDSAKTLPSGDIVGNSDTQTLTNKTIDDDNNVIQNLVYTALKTVVGNAGKTIKFNDSTGAPELQTYQGYTLIGGMPGASPADATTYYFGGNNNQGNNTTDGFAEFIVPKDGTIRAVTIGVSNGGTAGSADTSSISVRINRTTDTLITSALQTTGLNSYSNTSLNIAVVAGDSVQIKWVTPSWVTNPTTVRMNFTIYIE